MHIKKWLGCFLLCLGYAHPSSKAVNYAMGPSLGIGGWYNKFSSKLANYNKHIVANMALHLGGFCLIDFRWLYVKSDPSFILGYCKLTDGSSEGFRKLMIPLTLGVPLLGCFRPHIGLIFDSDSFCWALPIAWLFGLGLNVGKFIIDLDFEHRFRFSGYFYPIGTVGNKKVDHCLEEGQWSLRVGYNLYELFLASDKKEEPFSLINR